MGLVGGIIAAPCTGPPLAWLLAYVATTRDAVWGFALLATYGAGIGLPFWVLAGFSMSLPRSGRLDGVGEERVRHRAVHGRALLPEERRPGAGAGSLGRTPASRWRWRRSCWSGWRSAPCTELPRQRGRARPQGAGVGAGDGRAVRRHQLRAHAQGHVELAWLHGEAERVAEARAAEPAAAGRLRGQLVPALQGVRAEGLLAIPRSPPRCRRSRCSRSTSRARTTTRRWA